MMRRLLAAAVLAAAVLTPSPASADHQYGNPHWGHHYRPRVCALDPSIWHYSAEAEYGWNVNGYPNGFVTGPCGSLAEGNISYEWGDPGGGYAGVSLDTVVYDPALHMDRCRIIVQPSLPEYNRHETFNHELGHCLGLGHSAEVYSVMNALVRTKNQSVHDAQAMAATYNHIDP